MTASDVLEPHFMACLIDHVQPTGSLAATQTRNPLLGALFVTHTFGRPDEDC
jgi:hypothetical protein